MKMSILLDKLHNKFAFLRHRIEKKLAHDTLALRLFQACHQYSPQQLKQQQIAETRFVVIDTETTGFHVYGGDEMIEIAMLELHGLEPSGQSYQSRINPQRAIPAESTAIHHIRDSDVSNAPSLQEVLPDVLDFIDNAVLVGHHVNFDIRFINKALQNLCHGQLQNPWVDTMLLYLEHSGQIGHYTLEEVARYCQVGITGRHSAMGDTRAAAEIFAQLVRRIISTQASVHRLLKSQY